MIPIPNNLKGVFYGSRPVKQEFEATGNTVLPSAENTFYLGRLSPSTKRVVTSIKEEARKSTYPAPLSPPNNKSEFGYPSKEPCRVCGQYKNNQSEPRFCYTVCEDHQNVAPIDIPRREE